MRSPRPLRVGVPASRIRTKRASAGHVAPVGQPSDVRLERSTEVGSNRLQLVDSDREGRAADERRPSARPPVAVVCREPAEDPIGLSLDEDALELIGSRARVGRPALLQIGQAPRTLAGVLARRRLLDEAVLRELAQVERAARLARAELPRTRSSRRLTERPEQLDEVEAKWMGERAERARISDLHNAKDSFDIYEMSNNSLVSPLVQARDYDQRDQHDRRQQRRRRARRLPRRSGNRV